VVAAEAAQRGFRSVGLLGTKWLVQSDVYAEKLARRRIEYLRPEPAERAELNRIIMDELVNGLFKPDGIAYHQRVIERYRREGCDAVVLGCTEIPLIISDANSALPVLDSARLLARAALNRALAPARSGK
jgi:aspartate racemase